MTEKEQIQHLADDVDKLVRHRTMGKVGTVNWKGMREETQRMKKLLNWVVPLILGLVVVAVVISFFRAWDQRAESPPVKEVVFKGHAYIQIDDEPPWLHAAHCPCMARVTVKWGTNTIGEVDDYREEP